MVAISLKNAKFCINCEVIFTGETCPICGRDDNWVWLVSWLSAILNSEDREKLSDDYFFN